MKQFTNFSILIALFSTVILNACSKKNSAANKNYRIITVNYPAGILYNFTYTVDGKLRTVTYGNYATIFEYYPNHVVSTTFYSGIFNKKETITLNSTGLATNVRLEPGPSGETWGNFIYEYNGEQLIKRTFTSSTAGTPTVLVYNWTNGNNSSQYIDGKLFIQYEYYTDNGIQTGELNYLKQQFINGYEVLRNKNLTKVSTYSTGSKEYFTYAFDAAGKITTATFQAGTTIINYNYQYQCN